MCMGEIQPWRDKGVWIHGGAEPAVNRDAWRALNNAEKQQMADIAACIGSAGAFEPRDVQIVSEGFKVPIEKWPSDNVLFAQRVVEGSR